MPVLADPKGLKILLKALQEALPVSPKTRSTRWPVSKRAGSCSARPWPPISARVSSRSARRASCRRKPSARNTISNTARPVSKSKPTPYRQGNRVLIVDDLIATGGTAKAATDLIEKAGGTVVGFSFVMRLDGLDGLDKLDGKPSSSLIAMPARSRLTQRTVVFKVRHVLCTVTCRTNYIVTGRIDGSLRIPGA